MKRRRRRIVFAEGDRQPRRDDPEGLRAAWWREHCIKLSRPALGEKLGLSPRTIAAYEAMPQVPPEYRLACAALTGGLYFDWETASATIGKSTVIFG